MTQGLMLCYAQQSITMEWGGVEIVEMMNTCCAPVSDMCLHLNMFRQKRGARDEASCKEKKVNILAN